MSLLERIRRPECHRVRQVLQSFLDGELGSGDSAMVAAHLEHCERCGIEASLYEEVKESLGRLHQAPDPDAMERLRRFAADVPERADGHDDPPRDS